MEAAAELFAERGYHATTMQDLTEATGPTAGGLYHYIGSKEQLLIAICDALMEPLLERVDALGLDALEPEEALRALVGAWVEQVASHRQHMIVFLQERHVIEREPQWRHVAGSRKPLRGGASSSRRWSGSSRRTARASATAARRPSPCSEWPIPPRRNGTAPAAVSRPTRSHARFWCDMVVPADRLPHVRSAARIRDIRRSSVRCDAYRRAEHRWFSDRRVNCPPCMVASA